jgi:hypothetical protein
LIISNENWLSTRDLRLTLGLHVKAAISSNKQFVILPLSLFFFYFFYFFSFHKWTVFLSAKKKQKEMKTFSQNVKIALRDPLKYVVAPFLYFFYNSVIVSYCYLVQPWMKKWNKYKDNKPENKLLLRLQNSETFDEWQERAMDLDR